MSLARVACLSSKRSRSNARTGSDFFKGVAEAVAEAGLAVVLARLFERAFERLAAFFFGEGLPGPANRFLACSA
jgi:hypothetical protein